MSYVHIASVALAIEQRRVCINLAFERITAAVCNIVLARLISRHKIIAIIMRSEWNASFASQGNNILKIGRGLLRRHAEELSNYIAHSLRIAIIICAVETSRIILGDAFRPDPVSRICTAPMKLVVLPVRVAQTDRWIASCIGNWIIRAILVRRIADITDPGINYRNMVGDLSI